MIKMDSDSFKYLINTISEDKKRILDLTEKLIDLLEEKKEDKMEEKEIGVIENENEVNRLVDDYYSYQSKKSLLELVEEVEKPEKKKDKIIKVKPKKNPAGNMSKDTPIILDIIKEAKNPIKLSEVRKKLLEKYGHEVDPRAMTSRMKTVMNLDSNVQNVGFGLYQYIKTNNKEAEMEVEVL